MYKEQTSGLATISPATVGAGTRGYARMISGVRTLGIRLRIRATATLAAGPKTALRNAGSLWACVDQVGIEENGVDRVNVPGKYLRVLSEMVAPGQLPNTVRIASYADGAVVLEETAVIPFAWPLGAQPVDTCFLQRDPQATCQVFVMMNSVTTTTQLATTGTVTLSNITVEVQQVYDDSVDLKPYFIPTYRMISEPINAAVTAFPIWLRTAKYLRGIIVGQDTSVGEVNDIINNLALRGDNRDLIGPQSVSFEDLATNALWEFAGPFFAHGYDASVAATQPSTHVYLPINFQRQGRLGNILNPLRDFNLRVEVDGQASVTAGAAASTVRIMMMELERVQGLTAPELPFAA